MPRPVAVWGWPKPPSTRTIAASGVVLGGVQATLDVFTAAPSGSTYGWKGYRYVYVKREDGTVVRGGPIKPLGNTDHHAGWVPPWLMRPSGGTGRCLARHGESATGDVVVSIVASIHSGKV